MQQILTIVRGLPGSGKSSYAAKISKNVFAADDFFMEDGEYKFDPFKLSEAHAQCQERTKLALQNGNDAVVANTFTQRWEMEPYLVMAKTHNARVVVVDCFDGGMDDAALAATNVHGVPVAVIATMRGRWEHDWRAGNPILPWLR
jgi:predicted kinase